MDKHVPDPFDDGAPETRVAVLSRHIDGHPRDNEAKYELSRLLRQGYEPPRRLDEVMETPFSIANVELTNRCPMRCVMCPRTHDMSRSQGYMTFDCFRRVVDQLAEANRSNLPGCILYLHHFGESLLHPEFDRLASYANGLGLFTSVSVNPLALKPLAAERLLKGEVGLVQIALDGHDDASFERIRGVANAYDLSVARLHDYLRRKVESGSDSRVVLNMIDFPMNAASIEALAGRWRGTPGIDAVFLKPFVSWNGGNEAIVGMTPHARPGAEDGAVTCVEPFVSLNVNWDGTVVPCCFDHDKLAVVGDVAERPLAEIWNSPPLRALRREFMVGRVTNPLCRSCQYLRRPVDGRNVIAAAS